MDRFSKQPAEVTDVDFSFVAWLAARPGAAYASHTVTVDAGITATSTHSNGVVKVILTGGTNGLSYKVTVRYTTGTLVLTKEADCTMNVKDV